MSKDNFKPKKDSGTRNLVVGMVLLILLVGAGFSYYSNQSAKNVALPPSVSADKGYGMVFNPDATPKVDIYFDFQCPICKDFELINGGFISEITAAKKAQVIFHPMSFIGPESILAASAAGCAADYNKFLDFYYGMYQNQPATENSGAWDLEGLTSVGKKVGISDDGFKQCIKDGKYLKWVRNVANASAASNINGTPTVLVNGKALDRNTQYMDATAFRAALAAAGVK
jgi:protein-disulfide isomerase